MRNLAILAVSALLAACGTGKAATISADQADPASAQVNAGAEAVGAMNETMTNATEVDDGAGAMNAAMADAGAVTNAAATPEDMYTDGHLPAHWDHVPGDILLLGDRGFGFTQPGLHPYRYIDFGLPRAVTLRGVAIIRGRATGTGRTARCPGGPMDFTAFGALVLNFRHGRFVGWELNRAATPLVETFLGLGIGTPRDEVDYGDQHLTTTRNSPRGPQFEVGGIGGFLGSSRPDARVTGLYAGETCFARTPPQPQDD